MFLGLKSSVRFIATGRTHGRNHTATLRFLRFRGLGFRGLGLGLGFRGLGFRVYGLGFRGV